eukprot:CAMPEP_0115474324 /NCGR_PEP_ID=MMETSP0271-20121206/54036_1 /TAXON_ID=71861 /ORGANISM="Scrippsiella trochoidea, Strain CCMP3099" /LENGTH=76 /DNA_ID=CAMNT_0002901649 /DNA_START=44 /DNA_END=270 /DNA_ORIENTATION=-
MASVGAIPTSAVAAVAAAAAAAAAGWLAAPPPKARAAREGRMRPPFEPASSAMVPAAPRAKDTELEGAGRKASADP